jgi:hypothetical protein
MKTSQHDSFQSFVSFGFSMANQEALALPYHGAPFPTKWRRHHPRSKKVWLGCRTKRKKCDEVKPVCPSCTRNRQEFVWPTPEKTSQGADTEDGSPNEPLGTSSLSPYSVRPSSPRAAPTIPISPKTECHYPPNLSCIICVPNHSALLFDPLSCRIRAAFKNAATAG